MINDKPLKSTPLTQEEKVQFFSLVFQISYLNLTFEKVLEHRDSFEILRDVFTSPKKRNEMVSLIELVEMLTKSTRKLFGAHVSNFFLKQTLLIR